MITAKLNNHRQSPRKVRIVADLVRGKKVDRALTTLAFLTKKASDPVRSVIELAVANAKHNFKVPTDKLYIKEIRVDEGVTLKRRMPRARGLAFPIKKRSSHITVVLSEGQPKHQILATKSEIISKKEEHEENGEKE